MLKFVKFRVPDQGMLVQLHPGSEPSQEYFRGPPNFDVFPRSWYSPPGDALDQPRVLSVNSSPIRLFISGMVLALKYSVSMLEKNQWITAEKAQWWKTVADNGEQALLFRQKVGSELAENPPAPGLPESPAMHVAQKALTDLETLIATEIEAEVAPLFAELKELALRGGRDEIRLQIEKIREFAALKDQFIRSLRYFGRD
jgi:hypothetical protein